MATSRSAERMHRVLRTDHTINWPKDWRAFLLLLLITLAFWRVDVNFFWRDDWNFLSDMRDPPVAYFIQDHFGHVKPLFKLTFFAQLQVFGTNTIFYAYYNLLFVALGAYAMLRLLLRLTSVTAAWVTTIALLIHPLMFNHVGWTFEQCISQHLFFQVLAVCCFVAWVQERRRADLLATVAWSVVQNYFFGNGLFLPMLFVAGCLLFVEDRRERLRAAGYFVGLFLLFIAIQLGLGGDRAGMPSTVEDLLGLFSGSIHLLGIDSARAFFIQETAFGAATTWLSIALFTGLVALAVLRKDRDQRIAWFLVLWFGVAFCSVPLVRRGDLLLRTIPHYYSILCMIPLGFIGEHALGGRSWWSIVPRKLMLTGVAGLLLVVFLLDRQLMAMVSFRSFRNEQAMMRSLQDGTPYKGFDEPYFRADKDKVEDPLGIYRYWRERDRFRLPIGYANEPSNWTRTTPLSEE
ncbi:MAG TPA: hypothetical protein PKJ19_11390 [Flavobacteriales bacterium]|nr:hypothetical protein [Flavobacteriales bacterium]